MNNSKRQIILIVSILISGLLTLNISTFYHPFIILTLPGLLFGLALTIPGILPDFKTHKTELKISLAYPAIWAVCLVMTFFFQMVTPTHADKTPYVIIGLFSGLGVAITFDRQFGLKKRILGLTIVAGLSIIAVLLGDFLFPNPHEKELNIGKQIAIWEILVGIGLILNKKHCTTMYKR